MIICRTPMRVSFFGGGTDYPTWYRQHGGAVLATTIDKYSYITLRYLPPFFEHKYSLVYSRIEHRKQLDDIEHPSIREVIRYMKIDRGLEIHHDADLPARSGMGSSSAFTVGLLHALYALTGRMATKHHLATESVEIEQNVLKEAVGSQDQVQAAYGGFNHVTFQPNGEIVVMPVTVSRERLDELTSHLMLFYTGIKRTASTIANTFINNMDEKRRHLRIMNDLVLESRTILNGTHNITGFGELLHEAWQTKRSLSPQVTNSEVDSLYEEARRAGAIGGKLTGAGGGGFLLLFVPPERQRNVREQLSKLIHVPFGFEFFGSQVIFADREREYVHEEEERNRWDVAAFRELGDSPVAAVSSSGPWSASLKGER
jgi:D-glycero-alpha-D-manno-heptose-7-phosphate kinase